MIKTILRKIFTPVQILSDYVHRRHCQRLMMSHALEMGQTRKNNIRKISNEIN